MEIQFFSLFEGDSSMRGKINYTISFTYDGKVEEFESNSLKNVSSKIFDWLYSKGYSFDGSIHNSITRKLLTKSELDNLVKTTSYGYRSFHNVGGSNNFLINSYNSNIMINFIISMLKNFGIEEKSIKHNGFTDIYQKSIDDSDLRVFVVRAGVSNRDSKLFIDGNFVAIDYDTNFNINDKPKEEIMEFLLHNGASKNQALQYVQQIELFKEISVGDLVLVPDSEGINVGEVSSEIYYIEEKYPNRLEVEWLDKIEKNTSVNLPRTVFEIKNFDTENYEFTSTNEINPELTTIVEPEEQIQKFSNLFPSSFKAVQSQEEKESVDRITSPFKDAICILGSSGKGKSTTTEMILDSIPNLEYEFIIPSASTTNLLAQFSPSSERGGYVTSRLGKLIMKANNNPSKNYVAVFDECHKANIIEMINDELLQCISTKRNRGNRFISIEDEISELYKGLSDFRGNLLIPDNFGFVFLSSKPDVITSNSDFFNRVDIYIMMERPNEESIDDAIDYSDDKIKLNEPYFKHFDGKTPADIDSIKSTFDSM